MWVLCAHVCLFQRSPGWNRPTETAFSVGGRTRSLEGTSPLSSGVRAQAERIWHYHLASSGACANGENICGLRGNWKGGVWREGGNVHNGKTGL